MKIEVPDDYLVTFCGGLWGDNSATDIGAIIMNYLYGEPRHISERKTSLGLMLVNVLEHKLKK